MKMARPINQKTVDTMFSLNEAKGIKKRPGVLNILQGPCMEIEHVNQNNRFYPRELIVDRILNNEIVQHQINNKTLLGEGCHPENRFDVAYPEVAISVEKLWIPPEDPDHLYGRFAVLDTPVGNILHTLIEYGSRVGVSARASGSSTTNAQGVEVLNPDDYVFYTFDAVPDPGFASARPAVLEAKKKNNRLVENLRRSALGSAVNYMEKLNPNFFGEEIEKLSSIEAEEKEEAIVIPRFITEKIAELSEQCIRLHNENMRLRSRSE